MPWRLYNLLVLVGGISIGALLSLAIASTYGPETKTAKALAVVALTLPTIGVDLLLRWRNMPQVQPPEKRWTVPTPMWLLAAIILGGGLFVTLNP